MKFLPSLSLPAKQSLVLLSHKSYYRSVLGKCCSRGQIFNRKKQVSWIPSNGIVSKMGPGVNSPCQNLLDSTNHGKKAISTGACAIKSFIGNN